MKKSVSTQQTSSNIAAVLKLLEDTPAQLEAFSAGLHPEQLQMPLGEGERSFTEDVAHLVNCEARTAEIIYLVLLVDKPLIVDIHPERQWGKLMRHELMDCADLLRYFRFRRAVLLRVLHSLTDSQWSRTIRQEGKQRQESVYWQARTLALHELEHVTDLTQKIRLIFNNNE